MTKKLIFGHQNPDTDTIASAIAASYFLNKTMDQETEAVALGVPNAETQFALDYFKMEPLRVIENADTEQVYLVDHNEISQSVKNIDSVEVVGVYDHHKINFSSKSPLWFINMPLGSVATVLYYEFKKSNIEIPNNIAGLMASAIISDTLLLKSPTTTLMDKPALEDLAYIAGIKDYESYGLELLKAGTDLSSRTVKELIDGDAKSFDFNGHSFRIGQVNTVNIDEVLARKSDLEESMIAEGYDNFLFIITDILNSNSKAIYLGKESDAVSQAFSKPIEDNIIDLPDVVSRKKQVVPPLTNMF